MSTAEAINNGTIIDVQSTPAVPAPANQLTAREAFELEQRKAKVYSSSSLVPQQYQGNLANCIIAINMAARIGADVLMVMQNLYIVHGRPGWSGQFLIATFNQCGRFSAMRFEWRGQQGKKDWGCRAYATESATGEKIVGAWIDWAMVEAEGWSKKPGSKWLTMPEQMFMYRSAAFLVRTHAPEIAMGLHTAEELEDAPAPQRVAVQTLDDVADRLLGAPKPADSDTDVQSAPDFAALKSELAACKTLGEVDGILKLWQPKARDNDDDLVMQNEAEFRREEIRAESPAKGQKTLVN